MGIHRVANRHDIVGLCVAFCLLTIAETAQGGIIRWLWTGDQGASNEALDAALTSAGNYLLGAHDRISGTQRVGMVENVDYAAGRTNATAGAAGQSRVFTKSLTKDLTDADYLSKAYVGSVFGVVESLILVDLTPDELKGDELIMRSKYIARVTNDAGTFFVLTGKSAAQNFTKVSIRQGSKYAGGKAFVLTVVREGAVEGGNMLVDHALNGNAGVGSAGGRHIGNRMVRSLQLGKVKALRENRKLFRFMKNNLEKGNVRNMLNVVTREGAAEIAIRAGSVTVIMGAKEGLTLISPNDPGDLDRMAALWKIMLDSKHESGKQYILLPNPESPITAKHTALFKNFFQQTAPLRPAPFQFGGFEQMLRNSMLGFPGTGDEDGSFPIPISPLLGTNATAPDGETGVRVDLSVEDGSIGVEPVAPSGTYSIYNDFTAAGNNLILDFTSELTWTGNMDPESIVQITDQETGENLSVYVKKMPETAWEQFGDERQLVWFDEAEKITYDAAEPRFTGWTLGEFVDLFGSMEIHINAGENYFTTRQLAALTGTQISFAYAVPEPTTLGLLAIGCLGQMRRRRAGPARRHARGRA